MINKYVLFLFVCFCGESLCRRPPYIRPPASTYSGSGDVIPVLFIMAPNIGIWISLAITHYLGRRPKVELWEDRMKAPPFYPPNWLIFIIWTLLYFGIGYASYMVYSDCGGFTKEAILPFTLYGIQLLLNWSWSPILLLFRSTKVGLIHFLLLDICALACTASFFHINMYTVCVMGLLLAFLAYMTAMFYLFWKNNHETEHLPNEKIDTNTNTPENFEHKYIEHDMVVPQTNKLRNNKNYVGN